MRASRRAAVVAAALALLAAGCEKAEPSPDPTPTATPTPAPTATPAPPSDEAQLRELLARRAAALERGQARAFAATSTAARRPEDLTRARSARRLPLRDFDLEVMRLAVEGDRARLRVRAGYELAGVEGRFSAERVLIARRAVDGWRIAGERGTRRRLPWELEPYSLSRAGRFALLAPAGLDAGELPAALEAARRTGLPRRTLVMIAADPAAARALSGRIQGVERLAALTEAVVRTRGEARRVTSVVGVRLLIVWPRYLALDAAGRERVLRHELTHAALAVRTSGRAPAWLQEGLALYASGDRRVATAARLLVDNALPASSDAQAVRRGLSLAALAGPDAIARLSGPALTAAYAYSSAAAHYLGEARMRRLLAAFNDGELRGRAGPKLLDAALRRELGRSLAAFERGLRRWILRRL